MLPFYLFGNVHCFGMCGPLVMLIGHHPFRHLYFFGRLLAFSLAGLVAGGAGAVLNVFLKRVHLSEIATFLFGLIFVLAGLKTLFSWNWGRLSTLIFPMKMRNGFSLLLLKEKGWATLLFGFSTILLPCGQSLIVFSACALSGDPYVGLFNGFAFAVLTTPSLFLALYASGWLKKLKNYSNMALGLTSLGIGLLTFCRGLAEIGWISHWTLHFDSPHAHLVIF